MKLKNYWIVVAVTFMVMAFFRGSATAYNMAEYFPLNQGDKWVASSTLNILGGEMEGEYGPYPLTTLINGTEVVNAVETIVVERKMLISPETDYDCYVMDSEGLKVYKHYWPNNGRVIVIFDTPAISFPAQFDIDEVHQSSWTSLVYDLDNNFLGKGTGSLTSSIILVEDVTVPAGTFDDCLKISLSISAPSPVGSLEMNFITWYARNVGQIKGTLNQHANGPEIGDTELSTTFELISATVGGIHYGSCPTIFALGGDSHDLKTLRKFRDEVLSKTPVGQEIIKLYYEWSPTIVKAMREDEEFKEEVKNMIDEALPIIRGVVR